MEKNNTTFSIDGNGGAIEGQQLYLWNTNTSNVNQQWIQISHGDGYYSYKKQDTNLCWDGGSGGTNGQPVTLEICDAGNYDQHWEKIKVLSGTEIYRFQKRNASGYSIDGNGGAAQRQSIYLWSSSDSNVNQQWDLTRTDDNSDSSNNNAGNALSINTAFDDGSGHGSYPATNVIDGNTDFASRWAGSGSPVNLTVQLNETTDISSVGVAWGRGDSRAYTFEIYARPGTSGSWTKVYDDVSSGTTADIEVFDIDDIAAQQIRIKTFSNTANTTWTNITEVEVYGGGSVTPPTTNPTLDPSAPPSDNFDLSRWYLSIQTDDNGDGKADSIKEDELNASFEDSRFFYTANDGGMTFKSEIDGYKTSTNTSYTRSELREMLRAGDTSIDTSGVNENNWVFSSAPSAAQNAAGGVDGNMKATVAVNHVTSTGDSGQVGRVIIGQIHASSDEPVRLYYRLLPGHDKGSIYFAHEPGNGNAEQWYEMIGSRSSSASEPSDGIALNEVFSYEIDVQGDTLTVKILREGKATVTETVDMSNSGYDVADEYMYFKAGVYNQNNTGDGDDYVQATFYALEVTHD
ncbi:MAG TPA: translation initiation factor SUI1 [Alteromonas australica]|uniref:Translation initiation factor SUI1 n=3 Tax=Alteromonas australica TaxID=589873 RepID=A0A358E314_9ALTE|nr:translation initiation factor SUI1 [Alteromonas sp.]HAI73497.1 translation initiation factor SUI1 [Alteromonas australica]HBU52365.1 translation initiation factor SUI1 [Alteromonas australica]